MLKLTVFSLHGSDGGAVGWRWRSCATGLLVRVYGHALALLRPAYRAVILVLNGWRIWGFGIGDSGLGIGGWEFGIGDSGLGIRAYRVFSAWF